MPRKAIEWVALLPLGVYVTIYHQCAYLLLMTTGANALTDVEGFANLATGL
jgi:hypothetical protein